MKVGILTFQFAHNYGAQLQAYALKHYLELNGHEAIIINYCPSSMVGFYEISPFSKGISFKRRVLRALAFPIKHKQYSLFLDFQKNFLKLEKKINNSSEFNAYSKKFDLLIFGSDQLWNYELTGNDLLYYGVGLDNVSLNTYAVSLGINPDSEYIKRYSSFISKFKNISTREKTFSDFLRKNKIVSNYVLDPVNLLSKEQWINVCGSRHEEKRKKTAVFYSLFDDKKLETQSKNLLKREKVSIVGCHPTMKRQKGIKMRRGVGPIQFLDLLVGADYVCTNSFHALSLALILRKKIICSLPMKYSERVTSLLSLFGISFPDNTPLFIDSNLLDFTRYNKLLCESKNYLSMILGDEK